jgi:hypothetical protein
MKRISDVLLSLGILRTPKRPRLRWDRVVVVFTRPERDVAKLEIATGPCIPRVGTKRPLVGVTNQQPGDATRYESLFRILVADPLAEPWAEERSVAEASLRVFSAESVDALAALNRENLRRQDERPNEYDWIFEPERAVLRRWMPSVQWPVGASSVPIEASELGNVAAWARVAQERGQKLYCWSGPGFNPWVTAERISRLSKGIHATPERRAPR